MEKATWLLEDPKYGRLTWGFKQIPASHFGAALRVYEAANPEERQVLAPLMDDKWMKVTPEMAAKYEQKVNELTAGDDRPGQPVKSKIPGRAAGGRVKEGQLYEVGEQGPELLVQPGQQPQVVGQQGAEIIEPQQTGEIVPNDQIDTFAETLNKNKDLNFVKRILEPNKYPQMDNQDGTFSSHLMASATVGGKEFVFPTIIQDKDGELKKLSMDAAIKYALKNKEYIEFRTQEEADTFASGGYKKAAGWK